MKNIEESLELLNNDYIELSNSLEYRLGKNFLILKKKGIISFIKNMIVYFKMKKFNHKAPIKNEEKELNSLNLKNKKIVVYSALISNYDNIKPPLFVNNNCNYIMFTDQKIEKSLWKIEPIPQKIKELKNPILINRYIKMHPHEFFKDYDYAIYFDANIQIVSNITKFINQMDLEYGLSFHKHRYRDCIYEEIKCCHLLKKGNYKNLENQKDKYQKNSFPNHFGILECGNFVVDLKNSKAKEILDEWWIEFYKSASLRDQIALPYVLWKKQIDISKLYGLGNNMYKDLKIRVFSDHN